MAKDAAADSAAINTDEDRYPSVRKVLHAINNLEDLPKGDVDRIEVRTLASGEATYRIWLARELEPQGGYIPAEDLA